MVLLALRLKSQVYINNLLLRKTNSETAGLFKNHIPTDIERVYSRWAALIEGNLQWKQLKFILLVVLPIFFTKLKKGNIIARSNTH